ncbi:NTP transferase domain-containing protein [Halorientalis halophila]|uniref:NTP transferase domain-containing protein n=1 Tax=Halorientalis halophila TaxID=3108499 RepID=UPI00300A2609
MSRRTAGVVLTEGAAAGIDDGADPLHEIDGTPLACRVADRLAPLIDELVVHCRRERRDALANALDGATHEPRFALDTVGDRGPVFALRTVFRVAAAEYAVAVGPLSQVDPTLLAYLHNRARSGTADAVVPRVDGRLVPHCAVYRVDSGRRACETATRQPDPRLDSVLDRLDVDAVDEATVAQYADDRAFEAARTEGDA